MLREAFLPNRVLLVLSEREARAQVAAVPLLQGKRVLGEGGATGYVCEAGACQRPTDDPALFARQLAELARP